MHGVVLRVDCKRTAGNRNADARFQPFIAVGFVCGCVGLHGLGRILHRRRLYKPRRVRLTHTAVRRRHAVRRETRLRLRGRSRAASRMHFKRAAGNRKGRLCLHAVVPGGDGEVAAVQYDKPFHRILVIVRFHAVRTRLYGKRAGLDRNAVAALQSVGRRMYLDRAAGDAQVVL